MAIGRITPNVPHLKVVDPVAAVTAGANIGAKQRATDIQEASTASTIRQRQQDYALRAAALPGDLRARNLMNQKMMLDMTVENEQREAKLDALALANQSTAQNLVLRREETDQGWDRLSLERKKWDLTSLKAKNDLFVQNKRIDKQLETEEWMPAVNDYVEKLQPFFNDSSATPEDVEAVPMPANMPPEQEAKVLGHKKAALDAIKTNKAAEQEKKLALFNGDQRRYNEHAARTALASAGFPPGHIKDRADGAPWYWAYVDSVTGIINEDLMKAELKRMSKKGPPAGWRGTKATKDKDGNWSFDFVPPYSTMEPKDFSAAVTARAKAIIDSGVESEEAYDTAYGQVVKENSKGGEGYTIDEANRMSNKGYLRAGDDVYIKDYPNEDGTAGRVITWVKQGPQQETTTKPEPEKQDNAVSGMSQTYGLGEDDSQVITDLAKEQGADPESMTPEEVMTSARERLDEEKRGRIKAIVDILSDGDWGFDPWMKASDIQKLTEIFEKGGGIAELQKVEIGWGKGVGGRGRSRGWTPVERWTPDRVKKVKHEIKRLNDVYRWERVIEKAAPTPAKPKPSTSNRPPRQHHAARFSGRANRNKHSAVADSSRNKGGRGRSNLSSMAKPTAGGHQLRPPDAGWNPLSALLGGPGDALNDFFGGGKAPIVLPIPTGRGSLMGRKAGNQ